MVVLQCTLKLDLKSMGCEYGGHLVPWYISKYYYSLILLLYHKRPSGLTRLSASITFIPHIDGCLLCFIDVYFILAHNWCSRFTHFMPMGEANECAVFDLKVAVIPLKDFHLAFNWISSAGSRETKKENLTCLTPSVSCHLAVIRCHAFSTVFSVKVVCLRVMKVWTSVAMCSTMVSWWWCCGTLVYTTS